MENMIQKIYILISKIYIECFVNVNMNENMTKKNIYKPTIIFNLQIYRVYSAHKRGGYDKMLIKKILIK